MKKALIIIGSIGVLFLFISFIFPNLIGIPIAAYNSKKAWVKNQESLLLVENDSLLKFPKSVGYINDFENIFTPQQIIKLNTIIEEYEFTTTNEIAIVTINSIKPYNNINDFATDLANEWGIGKAEKNNGLLILFSKSLREIRISTGLGTEKKLTDEFCKNVISQTIIPEFKNGNYYIGIEKGLVELIDEWN